MTRQGPAILLLLGAFVVLQNPPWRTAVEETLTGFLAANNPVGVTIKNGKLMPIITPPRNIVSASASFAFCDQPPHQDCVIDGDTFYLGRQSVRIADIDAPETNPPRCEREAQLGEAATRRLHALINAGSFDLRRAGGRDEDRYGRKLRIAVRNGRSIGGILVAEGLARAWTGKRMPWCN